jgi:phosphate uptake regulator
MTVIQLAKALERIGDMCTNIAEDIIFLRTGDITRHAGAFEDDFA